MERKNTEKRICLLDLNYTLVSNQMETRMLRPFSRRMQGEEYRSDLLDAIKDDYVIIITARPNYQQKETMENVFKKTGWKPDEMYFNDIDGQPPVFKESALRRFVFPKHGTEPTQYYAVESNPRTRSMYAKYGIKAEPYEMFMKNTEKKRVQKEQEPQQLSLFDMMKCRNSSTVSFRSKGILYIPLITAGSQALYNLFAYCR